MQAARRPAITFITPHLRPNSGGPYAIEQFATGLAGVATVRLAVMKGPTRELPGVEVLSTPTLSADELPASDVLIVPADMKDPSRLTVLPPDRGRRVVLFQGFGAPGNPAIDQTLELADAVLAGSGWLQDEARRRGCRVTRFRYGVDPALFHAGPPAGSRSPVVAMIAGSQEWKGAEDGMAALRLVRARAPDVRVVVIGPAAAPVADEVLAAPPAGRREIGQVMRRTAVFACASWEEGFGLPGVEALACGAALATTDTKGSRDYARHGATALVSPSRRPALLAENILRLLDDTDLRERLAQAGREQIGASYPDWLQAAQEFGEALLSVAELPGYAPS